MSAGSNIEHLLYHDAAGRNFAQFEQHYQVGPTGINLYFGVSAARVAEFVLSKDPFHEGHRRTLRALEARASGLPEVSLNVSLLPLEQVEPYQQIMSDPAMALVLALSTALVAFRQRLAEQGVTLRIFVRYASEMNDPGTRKQPYGFKGQQPEGVPLERQIKEFKTSFRKIREAFSRDIPFGFSPALRANLGDRFTRLPQYFPGDDVVDAFSCTWYVGNRHDLGGAKTALSTYCRHRLGRGKPFGIDEMNGANPGGDRHAVLGSMFEHIDSLAESGIHFGWASIFLESDKWTVPKPDLSFLAQRFPRLEA